MPNSNPDVLLIGGGHNGLACALLLARKGLKVHVLEHQPVLGGAVRTEYPFKKAPELGISSGAYLLGLMPPELLAELALPITLKRRDPHYFLPTTGNRYLLFGSDEEEMKRQFLAFFSKQDWEAHLAFNQELSQLRDDLAPAWLQEPLSTEETAERFIRPALRQHFIKLVRGTAREYLDRFGFRSDLVKAMYAVTDAFSGLDGGYDTPGTGHNLLVHNMCRLPNSGGTWMIVEGGMGAISKSLADLCRKAGVTLETNAEVTSIDSTGNRVEGVTLKDGRTLKAKVVISNGDPFRTRKLIGDGKLPAAYDKQLDGMRADGTTFKVNLCLSKLPTFTCLPENRGQFGPTIHLLPDESVVLDQLRDGYAANQRGELTPFPSIEWYIHSSIDPTLQDKEGRHNSALFVEWVPYALKGTTWEKEKDRYVQQLLSICDRFAPGTSDLVVETFALAPPDIERHFGITRGHIHHVDNKLAFNDRHPYAYPIDGLYSCSAGTHPAGSVIGAAGHNAAARVLKDLGRA
jgi:phytoene dehydrogenase-like protein